MALNHTHDPAARSWLASANTGGDFPIQNLPFAVFRRRGSDEAFRGGVGIGDAIVDLGALAATPLLDADARAAAQAAAAPALNALFAMGPSAWRALRHALFGLLHERSGASTAEVLRACLVPQAEAEFSRPAQIGDYTDFYTSIHHAANVGRVIRPNAPVTRNFQWVPIAYHGRASTVGVNQRFPRPRGQLMPPGAAQPVYGPCQRLDYELELAIWIGAGNAQGEPIPLDAAEQHVFGFGLLNDWSARDIQFWEMDPLGPFLGKNFATTISPWIVTLEAMEPYRCAWERPAEDPQPLSYLESAHNRAAGAFDIRLEVWLETAARRARGAAPARLSATSFRHQYWSVAQMVAHHTVNGCSLAPGDLFGSGTISGPTLEEAGAIIELTKGGTQPVDLGEGEQRLFLQDGDAVMLRGWCEAPGHPRIGFGESRGEVLPARG